MLNILASTHLYLSFALLALISKEGSMKRRYFSSNLPCGMDDTGPVGVANGFRSLSHRRFHNAERGTA